MPLPRPIPDPLVELIARRLQVVGQPQRIRLLDRLDREGVASVGQLADDLGVSSYNASQHLGVLGEAGVVRRRQEGRLAHYVLVDPAVLPLYEQIADSLAEQLRELEARLDSRSAGAPSEDRS